MVSRGINLKIGINIYTLLYINWGFPHSSVGNEFTCNSGEPSSIPGSGRSLKKGQATHPVFLGFACQGKESAGKKSTCKAGDLGLIPGLGGSPGERKGYPLQYPGLENSMDYIVHGVAQSWT